MLWKQSPHNEPPALVIMELKAFWDNWLFSTAKFLDTIFRDMEELTVLSQDGDSADILAYALHLADRV